MDRAGILSDTVVSDTLVLVPEHGESVALSRAAWEATVDFLAGHQAFHDSLLEAWRRAPGVVVSDLQATRMAGLADHEADDPDTDPDDRAGLTRLASFCRASGGFLVAGPEALAVAAPPEDALPARPAVPVEPAEPPAWHSRARRLLGPFALLLIFGVKWIAKLKLLLFALPKIGFLKVALLGATNLWFYALFWGWQIAAWVIVLLLVHELGHAIAYKAFGLGVARIGFVPFLGAYAMSKEAPESAWVNALCALAGPLIGGARLRGPVVVRPHDGLRPDERRRHPRVPAEPLQHGAGRAVRRRRGGRRDPPLRVVRRHLRPHRRDPAVPERHPVPLPRHRALAGLRAC